MNNPAKILSVETLASRLNALRAQGKCIVHCHGVFDLLHVGHIRHLERARAMGDILAVTVTADRHVNKGPHRPAFVEQLRAEAVAALDCVDFVAISDHATAVEAIGLLRPHLYVKGAEFRDEDRDPTGGIRAEREAVEAAGGQLAFTDEITFSSSHLLNRYMPVLSEEARAFLTDFGQRFTTEQITGYLGALRPLKVLAVGEAIVDEYQYCQAIGKSSKAPALVAKLETGERFAGGILAVANHLAGFCDEVTVVTQLGALSPHEDFIRSQLRPAVRPIFLYRKNAPTIVKRRYVESYFFTNLLELYEINDNALEPEDNAAVCARLREEVPRHDLVVVVDYGHSMITRDAVEILCDRARHLAVNAQANAGNRGYHRISQYPRADYVCAAEHEMYLEARDWRGDLHPVVLDVSARLSCPRVLVTCGNRGALCYDRARGFVDVPAFATKVVDRVGAGDAFLSVTAPCVATGAPMEVVGFIGNVAGAEAVATVGHRQPLDYGRLAQHIRVLLT